MTKTDKMKKACAVLISVLLVIVIFAQTGDTRKEKGWQKIGFKTTQGVIDAIKQNVTMPTVTPGAIDSASYNAGHGFIGGAVDGIKDKHLTPDLDNAVDHYGVLAAQNLVKMRDSLMRMNDTTVGYWLLNWSDNLREKLAGEGLQLDTKKLLATILSDDTELRGRKIVRGIIDESLSPVTQKEMTDMVNVLGDAASKQAAKITDTILSHVDVKLNAERDKFNDDVHAYKYGLISVIFLLLVAVGIIAFILYLYRKHARLNDILTYQINKMDPEHFTALSENIQDHARREGMEKFLHNQLEKRALLGRHNRKPVNEAAPVKKD